MMHGHTYIKFIFFFVLRIRYLSTVRSLPFSRHLLSLISKLFPQSLLLNNSAHSTLSYCIRLSPALSVLFLFKFCVALLPVALRALSHACPFYQQRHNSDAPQLALTCLWCHIVSASEALLFVSLRTRFWKQTLKYPRTEFR